MKKLEDISKKDIFEVPKGYFDQLPLKIQSRIETATAKPTSQWSWAFRYALPGVVIAAALIFTFMPKSATDTQSLLASIPTEQLVAYLDESDISEQDLLDIIQIDGSDADSLNVQVQDEYLPGELEMNEYKALLENEL